MQFTRPDNFTIHVSDTYFLNYNFLPSLDFSLWSLQIGNQNICINSAQYQVLNLKNLTVVKIGKYFENIKCQNCAKW